MAKIIYDLETSGLNPYHDDIIEIGCKCVGMDESFSCLVQPLSDRMISDEIFKITGISNKMLKKQGIPPIDAMKQFLEFLSRQYLRYESITLISHNGSSFDDIFLKRYHRILQGKGCIEYDKLMNNVYYIDTLPLSRLLIPGRCSYSMKSLCKHYNIVNESEHRAMGDVTALEKIWDELHTILIQKYGTVYSEYIRYLLYC